MTLELVGYFDKAGQIRLADPGKLKPMRQVHKAGEAVRVIFNDEVESKHEGLFKAFHVYRDQYAAAQGLEAEYAKALLKLKYGPSVPYTTVDFRPPLDWKFCRFVEIEGRIYCLKSTLTYTAEELSRLIESTIAELNGRET